MDSSSGNLSIPKHILDSAPLFALAPGLDSPPVGIVACECNARALSHNVDGTTQKGEAWMVFRFWDLRNKQVSFLGITLFYIHSPSYPVSGPCNC